MHFQIVPETLLILSSFLGERRSNRGIFLDPNHREISEIISEILFGDKTSFTFFDFVRLWCDYLCLVCVGVLRLQSAIWLLALYSLLSTTYRRAASSPLPLKKLLLGTCYCTEEQLAGEARLATISFYISI